MNQRQYEAIAPFNPGAFITEVKELLERKYQQVVPEWQSAIGNNIYSPRVDLAIGPFSVVRGGTEGQAYDVLWQGSQSVLRPLARDHRANTDDVRSVDQIMEELGRFNWNARCFIAIEVENAVSQKHLLGGVVNASTLGRIALVVGGNQQSHDAFIRLRNFFAFLNDVEKNGFDPTNVLVVTPRQLLHALAEG